jgi:protein-disulfide isomerase/uncharacterized membrane protein
LIALLVVALIGAFACSFLTYRHIVLASHTGAAGDSALCRAEGLVNCDGILITDYSVLFGYFPSSVLGLMGFSFVLWLVISSLFVEHYRKITWALLTLYFCTAIGFSWYYIYIMIFEMDFICTWCIVVHVVNFLSLGIVLTVAVRNRLNFLLPDLGSRAEKIFFVLGAFITPLMIFFAASFIENLLSFKDAKLRYEELANDPTVIMTLLRNSPTQDIPVSADDPVFGNPDSPHKIVLFSDFQCPLCSQQEDFLKRIVSLNQDKICLVYKNYPLSNECNSFLLGNLHPQACKAAQAAYAAFLLKGQEGFQRYGDLLFGAQKQLKQQPWFEYANRVGLDERAFTELMKPDSRAARKLKQDVDLGADLKINSTPQMFLEGKNIPQSFKGEFLVDGIEELVRSKYPDKQDFELRRR